MLINFDSLNGFIDVYGIFPRQTVRVLEATSSHTNLLLYF